MPNASPDRVALVGTLSTQMYKWHHEDRPDCPNSTRFIVGPLGYHCVDCDWWMACD